MERHRRRVEVAGVVVLLACATVVRFLAPDALWLDEAQSVAIARLPVPELLDALRQDGSPPLYYLLLHEWIRVVGSGPVAVRALSGLVGVLTLPAVWVVARRSLGTRAATVLLLLVASSPFAIRYASETRMYSLVLLLVALGGLAVQGIHRGPRPGPVVGLALVTGALLLTHLWALHLVAVVALLAALRLRARPATTLRVLLGLAGGVVLFGPWIPLLLVQLAHTGSPWATTRGFAVFPVALQAWQGGSAVVAVVFGAALVAAAALGCRSGGARAGWLAAVVLGGLVVAAVVSAVTGSGVSGRYTSIVVLPFLGLVAIGLTGLGHRVQVMLVAALTVGGLMLGAVSATTPRTQAAQVADALTAAAPGDVVVFCPDQLGPAVSRLAPTGLDLLAYPDLGPADRVDWTDYAQRNEAADPAQVAAAVLRRGAGHGIWVVTGSGYVVPSDERCQQLVDALSGVRGRPAVVVQPAENSYERDRLVRFPAAG